MSRTCLNHYDNNTDRLVNALFDNTVPEHLQVEALPAPAPSPFAASNNENEEIPFISKEFSLVDQRLNVYDNDEFDLFNQNNVDFTKIHRGKKTRDTLAILDDKSHLEGMDERYARLGLIEDISDAEGDYDDEYDDTYDDGTVNVQDKGDTIDNDLEKNENRITGKQPGHFRYKAIDGDEDEDDNNTPKNKRREFVENPEVVRERWAQQRAAWQQRHQPNRSHTAQPPQQQHDVTGATRGRGQSTTVTHNRRWKDENKSTQGNHNRRNRAAQKANRGLLS